MSSAVSLRYQLDPCVCHHRFLPHRSYHEGVDIEFLDLREVGDQLAYALQRFGDDGEVDPRLAAEALQQSVRPGPHQHAHGFSRGDGSETTRNVLSDFHEDSAQPEHEHRAELLIPGHAPYALPAL